MLTRDERHWLPWAPVLLVQGLYARLRAGRLPPARDPSGCVGTGAPALRLVGLGDSIIAGIGVSRQTEGLTGQVSAQVARRAGRAVEWQAMGASGVTSERVVAELLEAALRFEPQLAVLSVGVNDAVTGVAPALFKQRLRHIVEALTASRRRPTVVFAGIPPLDTFPALPRPLSRLLGDRARRLQASAVELTGYRGLKVVSFPPVLERAAFARDGFHPGPAGCATWATWVADGFALRLGELREHGDD